MKSKFVTACAAVLFCSVSGVNAQDVPSEIGAKSNRGAAAIGHYSKARALLIEAIREFEEGKRIARPDLVVNADDWRSGVDQKANELLRLTNPTVTVTESGIRTGEFGPLKGGSMQGSSAQGSSTGSARSSTGKGGRRSATTGLKADNPDALKVGGLTAGCESQCELYCDTKILAEKLKTAQSVDPIGVPSSSSSTSSSSVITNSLPALSNTGVGKDDSLKAAVDSLPAVNTQPTNTLPTNGLPAVNLPAAPDNSAVKIELPAPAEKDKTDLSNIQNGLNSAANQLPSSAVPQSDLKADLSADTKDLNRPTQSDDDVQKAIEEAIRERMERKK